MQSSDAVSNDAIASEVFRRMIGEKCEHCDNYEEELNQCFRCEVHICWGCMRRGLCEFCYDDMYWKHGDGP